MTRLPLVDPAAATGRVKTVLDGQAARRGKASAMMRAVANSPAALYGLASFNAALAGGVLPETLREQISIAVAEANHCRTCLAAHTSFGRSAGLGEAELAAARAGRSANPKAQAALTFALRVMATVGDVADEELAAVRAAGYGDDAIMEITALVFLNVFTNAVNHVAGTAPDYPEPPLRA